MGIHTHTSLMCSSRAHQSSTDKCLGSWHCCWVLDDDEEETAKVEKVEVSVRLRFLDFLALLLLLPSSSSASVSVPSSWSRCCWRRLCCRCSSWIASMSSSGSSSYTCRLFVLLVVAAVLLLLLLLLLLAWLLRLWRYSITVCYCVVVMESYRQSSSTLPGLPCPLLLLLLEEEEEEEEDVAPLALVPVTAAGALRRRFRACCPWWAWFTNESIPVLKQSEKFGAKSATRSQCVWQNRKWATRSRAEAAAVATTARQQPAARRRQQSTARLQQRYTDCFTKGVCPTNNDCRGQRQMIESWGRRQGRSNDR